ncbi:DUF885 family protein [Pseudoalteromonas sp.]|uniref:DUF885 family protein n=1 Tax=Pseudoalteromonas sp. TaxID=53249 RepID=UPI0035675012
MLIRLLLINSVVLLTSGYAKANESHFDDGFNALVTEVTHQPYLSPQLDFANAITVLKNQPKISEHALKDWQEQLTNHKPQTHCDKIAYNSLAKQLKLIEKREKLKAGLSQNSRYQGSFSSLPNGREWYLHWLDTWLMDDITPSLLKEVARAELENAFAEYQKLKAEGVEGDTNTISAKEHNLIVDAFRKREAVAKASLHRLFALSDFDAPLTIAASGLPESFPAPGIYDNQSQTFLYHPHSGVMNPSHFDWLYLHEGIPGHHLQFNVAQKQSLCPTNAFAPITFVTSEGWAAYVETLGKEIGLYQMKSSEAYALSWRVLRALRVLIDIGIHYENWSDERAQIIWQKYLPEQQEIMQREIKRIKNWPAQVITYVYGKYLIEKAIEPHANNRTIALNHVLRLSNQMPLALSHLDAFMPTNQKNN